MNDKQARDAASQIMAGDPPGTHIFLTNEDMASNPHGPDGHLDAFYAEKQASGQIVVHKEHVPPS